MTATSHAVTGAAIALIIKEPLLAVPLSFASHFVLDVLPHFGMHTWEERNQHPKIFKSYFVVEFTSLICGLILLIVLGAPALVYICSLIAMSPDFAWGYRFIFLEKLGRKRPPDMNWFNHWHSAIQTQESIVPGMYIEIIFSAVLLSVVVMKLL